MKRLGFSMPTETHAKIRFRKRSHADRSHNPWCEAVRRARCGMWPIPLRGEEVVNLYLSVSDDESTLHNSAEV